MCDLTAAECRFLNKIKAQIWQKITFAGGIIPVGRGLQFSGEIDLKLDFPAWGKDRGNKICFDQLNYIFAEN
jgi:hypothetical protein